jgi:multimeric flavodoxin WrbA
MKILVLAGSPKGEKSVTLQYVRWLGENLEGCELETVQIASRIVALEKDAEKFASVIEAAKKADAVIWAFPLYVFTVCSQYKRFIELVHERGAEEAFRGKYAASLSTSIHFFDHTAHEYIRGVAEDLGMHFAGSFSAKMDDLLKPESRAHLLAFGRGLVDAAERKLAFPRRTAALPMRSSAPPVADAYPAAGTQKGVRAGDRSAGWENEHAYGKKVLVLVDYPEEAIGAMARRFAEAARAGGLVVDILPLADMGIKGGCMGCLKCGQANRCAWEGKDGFIEAFRTKVMTADLLVFAGSIRDRAFSSRFKAFFDRGFFNTHQRTLEGKQFFFLASGPLSVLGNLRETLQAYVEWQGGNLVDFVSDEVGTSRELDDLIDSGAARSIAALDSGAMKPATFLGVGGMKIFRDDIFGGLRIVFKGDHRAYRKAGIYDFPNRNPLKRIGIWMGYWMTSIPAVNRKMMLDFPSMMLMPYKRLFKASGK